MRKSITIVITLVVLFWLYSIITGFILVIPVSKYSPGAIQPKQGDTVKPLTNFDFNTGKWKAYIAISRSDYKELNTSLKKVSLLKTTDLNVLNGMKGWEFKETGGDMATVESMIYIFHDGTLVFKSGIVLGSSNSGLQNSEYGWLTPIDKDAMIKSAKEFKQVYWPIAFL